MGLNVKFLFFDRAPVIAAVDAATRKVLSKAGAFVRRAAQTSMRYSGKDNQSAQPGQPPRAHKQNPLLRKLLFFSYDPQSKSVVAGPVPFRAGIVPRLQEEGGTAVITSRGKRVSARFRPHPYMGPALAKELPNLPSRWNASVKP